MFFWDCFYPPPSLRIWIRIEKSRDPDPLNTVIDANPKYCMKWADPGLFFEGEGGKGSKIVFSSLFLKFFKISYLNTTRRQGAGRNHERGGGRAGGMVPSIIWIKSYLHGTVPYSKYRYLNQVYNGHSSSIHLSRRVRAVSASDALSCAMSGVAGSWSRSARLAARWGVVLLCRSRQVRDRSSRRPPGTDTSPAATYPQ